MASDKLNSFIEELKAKNDIVSVVSRYVPLERRGRSFWGRCPFHSEKTPSFTVNEYDQFYHCFGCGVGGDVIKFIQEIESVDFMGAVNILADLAKMQVPSFSSGTSDEDDIKKRKEEKERLTALMRDAARHYVDNLKTPQSKPGRIYFEKRKISPEIARRFGIGFSINFNDIIEFLQSKGYTIDEMVSAGVVKLKDGRPYDALGGRVIFPTIDTSNNVIAFCGRTLESHPDRAKYINTSDTVLFSKSKSLFGINLVKKEKLSSNNLEPIIVVEGQMDAVSLHKAGFTSAVASMGTALTIEQAKLIKRFSDKVYICYDGDTAGKKATLRGLDILKSTGLDVYVMSMPEGMDPDDIINKYGAEGYRKLIDKALPLIDFKLEFLKHTYNISTAEGRTKYLNEAISILKGLSEVEREIYIEKVSKTSGILRDFIERQVSQDVPSEEKKEQETGLTQLVGETKQRPKLAGDSKEVQAEKYILSSMLHKKPYAFFRENMVDYFTEERQDFYQYIVQLCDTATESEIPNLFYTHYSTEDADETEKNDKISEIINYIYKNSGDSNDENYFKDCVRLVVKAHDEREIAKLTKLLECEVENDKRNQIKMQIKEILEKSKNKKGKV